MLELHKEQGWDFVKRVGQEPKYLEDVTGLTELMQVIVVLVTPAYLACVVVHPLLQDCDLMDGVVALGDDDCISISSDF